DNQQQTPRYIGQHCPLSILKADVYVKCSLRSTRRRVKRGRQGCFLAEGRAGKRLAAPLAGWAAVYSSVCQPPFSC
ncbi:MAG: hypothetical protein LBC27_09695, partial [Spirochaetaceae bacterium]|nr:hypothetical protein [Spirochaetaceae bacterium]